MRGAIINLTRYNLKFLLQVYERMFMRTRILCVIIVFNLTIHAFSSVVEKPAYQVLLSDNIGVDIPSADTKAVYFCDPTPNNPADSLIPKTSKGRLQNGDVTKDWNSVIGWNNTDAIVIFDLKDVYDVSSVDIRLITKAAPKSVLISTRIDKASDWDMAGTISIETGESLDWKTIDMSSGRMARYVRIELKLNKSGFYLKEVRIWGRLGEDNPERVSKIISDDSNNFTIVKDDKPGVVIIVDPNDSLKVATAARVLQEKISEISGVILPVVGNNHSELPDSVIAVGPKAAKVLGVDIEQQYPGNERFVVDNDGCRIIIAGNDEGNYEGTFMAVCTLLEQFGARFYRYDDPNYLIIPELKTLELPKISKDLRPAFKWRDAWLTNDYGSQEKVALWRKWNRMGGIKIFTSHNEFIPKSAFEEHPEYFAFLNGKRTNEGEWQYCTTNEDVISLTAKAAAQYFDKYPNVWAYSISNRDCGGFCQCEKCKKIDALYNGNPSAGMIIFANKVKSALDENYPRYSNRQILFYAYWYTKNPPLEINMIKGVVPMVVGDSCHLHQLNDGDCQENTNFRNILNSWQSISTDPVAMYEWYIPAFNDQNWEHFPWISIDKTLNDRTYFKSIGIEYMYYETRPNLRYCPIRWVTNYIAVRGMWDSKLKTEEILTDICQKSFGSAVDEMYSYYQTMDMVLRNAEIHAKTWRLPKPSELYGPEVISKLNKLLQVASQKVRSNSAAYERVIGVQKVWQKALAEMNKTSESKAEEQNYNPEF